MSKVDIRNYGEVIESLSGPMVEKERLKETLQPILQLSRQTVDLQIIRQGPERYYPEALVDNLLDENGRQRQTIEQYKQTFEETDFHVRNLLLRLALVFAVILMTVVFVLGR